MLRGLLQQSGLALVLESALSRLPDQALDIVRELPI
jgi:hypothetical protein